MRTGLFYLKYNEHKSDLVVVLENYSELVLKDGE